MQDAPSTSGDGTPPHCSGPVGPLASSWRRVPESVRLAGAIFGTAAVFAVAYRFLRPAEDAAILFRYSDHLCMTGRIAYNAAGPVTEGATDFLWMLLLAAGRCLGLDPFASALILSVFGVIGTAACLAHITGARESTALVLWILVLTIVPGLPAALLGFSVFFFGFWCTLVATAFWCGRPRLLLLAGLVACLVRPDGVVFVLPAVVAYGIAGTRSRKRFVWDTALLLLAPGAAYFLWRWLYFGEFLPLPFYVKSQFERTWGLFHQRSLLLQAVYLLALLPVIVAAVRGSVAGRRLSAMAAVFLIVPLLFYATMALSQNVGHRFQFPLLAIAAVVWTASRAAPANRRPSLSRSAPLVAALVLAPIWLSDVAHLLDEHWSTRPGIARATGTLERGKMAVVAAGVLPYYSNWDAVDLWGLNTRALTRRLADPAWIEAYDPDLIVINTDSYAFLDSEPEVHVARSWDQMCMNAALAAQRGGYEPVFVPVRGALGQTDGRATLTRALLLFRSFISRSKASAAERVGIPEPRHGPRYDVYFIAPDYRDRVRLRELLESYGGLDAQGYRDRVVGVGSLGRARW